MPNNGAVSTPVYVPYATFLSALDNLRTHGIPGTGKIDKTLWDTQSGAIQGQLLIAFRFLGLIDEQNKVLSPLPPLAAASAEERKPMLKKIMEEKYKSVLSRDLNTISQGQLEEAFRAFNISGSTLVRAIRFFVKACQEVGIPISKRVSEKTRSTGSQPRRPRRISSNGKRENGDAEFEEDPPAPTGWEEKLLAKFPQFDPAWPDELKTKWFESFEKLMKAGGGQK